MEHAIQKPPFLTGKNQKREPRLSTHHCLGFVEFIGLFSFSEISSFRINFRILIATY